MDLYRLLPLFWFQNTPTNLEWDALLNEALDQYTPVQGHYVAKIGPLIVWIENWPYQYGYLTEPVERRGLPKVATRLRLRRALKALPKPVDPKNDYSVARRLLSGQPA